MYETINEQLKTKQVFYDIIENILFKSYINDAKSIKRLNSFMKPEKILGSLYKNIQITLTMILIKTQGMMVCYITITCSIS